MSSELNQINNTALGQTECNVSGLGETKYTMETFMKESNDSRGHNKDFWVQGRERMKHEGRATDGRRNIFLVWLLSSIL